MTLRHPDTGDPILIAETKPVATTLFDMTQPSRRRIQRFRFVRSVMVIRLWVCLLTWFSWSQVFTPRTAQGFSPQREVLQLPSGNQAPAGFVIRLLADDLRLLGEIPLQIEITSWSGTFAAERNLTLRIETERRSAKPAGREFHYEIPIKLTQGASRVSKTMYLPKWTVDGTWNVSVIEDGSVLKGYQGILAQGSTGRTDPELLWRESADVRYAWVVEDLNNPPDARTFFAVAVPELLNQQLIESCASGFEFGERYHRFSPVTLNDLAADWRYFDTADVWIMSADVLRQVATKKPQQLAALTDFLIGGGTLWLLGDLDEKQVREWFKLPAEETIAPAKDVRDFVSELANQWQFRAFESLRAGTYGSWYGRAYLYESTRPMSGFGSVSPNQATQSPPFDLNIQWLEQKEKEAPVELDSFTLYSMGLGGIVQCKSERCIPGSPVQWVAMDQLTGVNLVELMRRGVDPCFGDRRFFDWLVPGVAQPPVYTFIGLLIVFVIVVGPYSYRKTTKLGRGYLMMFIAPVLAGVTTLLMFGYGLIADGLSIQGRIREITFVGNTEGRAVRYSRGAYFAGISPVAGLTFPADASVISYDLPTVNSFYEASQSERSAIGTVTLTDEELHFSRNFLPSRQQKQFIAYRPVADFGTLTVESKTAEDGSAMTPTVKNETPLKLTSGIIRSKTGEYFGFEELDPKQQVTLTPLIGKDARTMLSKLYARQRPLPPAAMSGARRRETSTVDMLSRLASENVRVPRIRTQVNAGESLIENWLRQHLQLSSEIPTGYFIAVSDVTSDCIATEVENLTESVHYVTGVIK